MRKLLTWVGSFAIAVSTAAYAAELNVPKNVVAGTDFSITSDTGSGTFYLIGPGSAVKSAVTGSEISVAGTSIEQAGEYTAILCSSDCTSVKFYVRAAEPDRLSLLVHPSRVPVATSNAISAVALVLDRFHNIVLLRRR